MLNIESATCRILVPRMPGPKPIAIPIPAQSMLAYDINTNSLWFYNALGGQYLLPLAGLLKGNAGTVDGAIFIGNTYNVPFNISSHFIIKNLLICQ